MRVLICVFNFFVSFYLAQGSIDLKKTKIYGPGLNPVEIVMPARYFFVNFTESLEKTDFSNIKADLSISITGKYRGKRECRITVNVLDRKDGVFIVRYKLHESCGDFMVIVKFKGTNLGDSPYIFSGTVVHEECYCPQENINDWLRNHNCLNKNYKQIYDDLKPFRSVNFTSFRKEALKKFDHPGSMSVCNYVVLKNQIYRKCYGEHVGFKIFMDAILLSIARKTLLPDFEIFVNLGDWPLVKKDGGKVYPLFSWCGSDSTYDIVMPTYDLTQSSLECMGRVSLDMLSVQGNIDKSWSEKESKAFWRGRDASLERLKLIEIARQNPNLFNASLTNFFFFRDRESEYGPKEKHISFFKFFDYKYQLNLDGTVAAYRFPFLLVGNSLVFKQESNYYEHFYSDLKPFHHYVPVKRDLSDLVEKIEWAVNHDDEAKVISTNGQNYALDNLLPLHVFCYHSVLFNEWSKLIDSPVKKRKNMEHVSQPDQEGCICGKEFTKKKVTDEL